MNLKSNRLRAKHLVCSSPAHSQPPQGETAHQLPQCREAKASPTQQGQGCSSLPSHTQAGQEGPSGPPQPSTHSREQFWGGGSGPLSGCWLPETAHSQRKRTYQMVSFFSCGPKRGLAWARMAMSQLQKRPGCRQTRQHGGRDEDRGMLLLLPQGAGRETAAPGCGAPGWEAGRSPRAVPFIHGQEARQQPQGPVWGAGRGGEAVPGPGSRYSQEVAAHGGGDQHRDDHPAETPALGR